jgi:hypothetical protein
LEDAENLKTRNLPPPPKPVPTAKGSTKMHLTFRDGFNFGSGFFVANLVAALLMGLVVFVLMMISTVIGLAGLASMFPH